MKVVVIGVHLRADDVEPLATSLPACGLFLSGVEVPDEQPLSDRDLLVRAGRVRQQLIGRATFIAVRYGWAVSSAADAASRCAPMAERWRALLEDNRDNVELALKVVAAKRVGRPDRNDFESGAGYLRALHASTRAAAADPEFREAVERRIVPMCEQHRWLARDDASLELAALIRREKLPDLERAGAALKSEMRAVPFLLSAPWPLEVFADADQQ